MAPGVQWSLIAAGVIVVAAIVSTVIRDVIHGPGWLASGVMIVAISTLIRLVVHAFFADERHERGEHEPVTDDEQVKE